MRIPLAAGFYEARALPHSSQRLVNLYAEKGEEKDPFVVYGTPGLVSDGTAGSGPIRGAIEMGGTAYVVSGSEVYSYTSAGVATQIAGVPIDGSGPVSLATNGTQIMVVTDQNSGYVVTTSSVAEITDSDFPGAQAVAFLDGYMVCIRQDSDSFFVSSLNDATSYSATDFATAESAPDYLVSLVIVNRQVWLFGTKTTEVWFNAGNSGFPLSRSTILERGCAGRMAACAADNTAFFFGDNGIAYKAENYIPLRISTHAIEEALRGQTISDCQVMTYSQAGHLFVVFLFPTAGLCFVYDAATGKWHERESYGLSRWRPSCLIDVYGKTLAGDYNGSTLWKLDLDTYTENGGAIVRRMTLPYVDNNYQRGTVHTFALNVEAGVGLTSGQGSDPQVMMRYSKDGGKTWSNELWRGMGAIGAYDTRSIWRRLGQFGSKGMLFDVQISDPVKVAILGGYIEAEGNAL